MSWRSMATVLGFAAACGSAPPTPAPPANTTDMTRLNLRDVDWTTFALPLERGAPLPDGDGFDYALLNVVYGDLDGDGAEEAAINAVQTYGGNGGDSHILVYRAGATTPTLIGDVTGGDRALGGAVAEQPLLSLIHI